LTQGRRIPFQDWPLTQLWWCGACFCMRNSLLCNFEMHASSINCGLWVSESTVGRWMGRRLCMQRDATIYTYCDMLGLSVWMRACIMHSRSTLAGAYWLKVFMLAAHNARSLRRRPICLPIAFNIKLFAACSTPRAHIASLLLCIYTQCSLPNLYRGIIWMYGYTHLDLHAPAAWTIGPQTKSTQIRQHPLDRRWLHTKSVYRVQSLLYIEYVVVHFSLTVYVHVD
jgi:hypothetical protein